MFVICRLRGIVPETLHQIFSANQFTISFPLLEGADGVVQEEHRHAPTDQVQVDGRILRWHSCDEILQNPQHLVKFGGIVTVSAHYKKHPWFVMLPDWEDWNTGAAVMNIISMRRRVRMIRNRWVRLSWRPRNWADRNFRGISFSTQGSFVHRQKSLRFSHRTSQFPSLGNCSLVHILATVVSNPPFPGR